MSGGAFVDRPRLILLALALSFLCLPSASQAATKPMPPAPQWTCRWGFVGTWNVVRSDGARLVFHVVSERLGSDPKSGNDNAWIFEGSAVDVASGRSATLTGAYRGVGAIQLLWITPPPPPAGWTQVAPIDPAHGPDYYSLKIEDGGLASGTFFLQAFSPPGLATQHWHATERLPCVRVPLTTIEVERNASGPDLPAPSPPSGREYSDPGIVHPITSSPPGGTTGLFATSFGRLSLNAFGGTYETGGGRVTVTAVHGNVVQGRWEQNTASRPCSNGRYYGSFVFNFTADGFTGSYGYCDDPPTDGPWNGRRLSAPGGAIR